MNANEFQLEADKVENLEKIIEDDKKAKQILTVGMSELKTQIELKENSFQRELEDLRVQHSAELENLSIVCLFFCDEDNTNHDIC